MHAGHLIRIHEMICLPPARKGTVRQHMRAYVDRAYVDSTIHHKITTRTVRVVILWWIVLSTYALSTYALICSQVLHMPGSTHCGWRKRDKQINWFRLCDWLLWNQCSPSLTRWRPLTERRYSCAKTAFCSDVFLLCCSGYTQSVNKAHLLNTHPTTHQTPAWNGLLHVSCQWLSRRFNTVWCRVFSRRVAKYRSDVIFSFRILVSLCKLKWIY